MIEEENEEKKEDIVEMEQINRQMSNGTNSVNNELMEIERNKDWSEI